MQILQTGIFGIIMLITQLKMVLAGVPEEPEHHFDLITIVGGGEKSDLSDFSLWQAFYSKDCSTCNCVWKLHVWKKYHGKN